MFSPIISNDPTFAVACQAPPSSRFLTICVSVRGKTCITIKKAPWPFWLKLLLDHSGNKCLAHLHTHLWVPDLCFIAGMAPKGKKGQKGAPPPEDPAQTGKGKQSLGSKGAKAKGKGSDLQESLNRARRDKKIIDLIDSDKAVQIGDLERGIAPTSKTPDNQNFKMVVFAQLDGEFQLVTLPSGIPVIPGLKPSRNMILMDLEMVGFGDPEVAMRRLKYENELYMTGVKLSSHEIRVKFWIGVVCDNARDTVKMCLDCVFFTEKEKKEIQPKVDAYLKMRLGYPEGVTSSEVTSGSNTTALTNLMLTKFVPAEIISTTPAQGKVDYQKSVAGDVPLLSKADTLGSVGQCTDEETGEVKVKVFMKNHLKGIMEIAFMGKDNDKVQEDVRANESHTFLSDAAETYASSAKTTKAKLELIIKMASLFRVGKNPHDDAIVRVARANHMVEASLEEKRNEIISFSMWERVKKFVSRRPDDLSDEAWAAHLDTAGVGSLANNATLPEEEEDSELEFDLFG